MSRSWDPEMQIGESRALWLCALGTDRDQHFRITARRTRVLVEYPRRILTISQPFHPLQHLDSTSRSYSTVDTARRFHWTWVSKSWVVPNSPDYDWDTAIYGNNGPCTVHQDGNSPAQRIDCPHIVWLLPKSNRTLNRSGSRNQEASRCSRAPSGWCAAGAARWAQLTMWGKREELK